MARYDVRPAGARKKLAIALRCATASVLLLGLAVMATSCRTIPPLRPADTAKPGWTVRQGQGVWRARADAPEIAGEVLFASHPSGEAVLQFTKNPIPFVTVQTSNALWQIEFVPQKRTFSGRGTPTPRLLWVHLARGLQGGAMRDSLRFTNDSSGGWQISNPSSGETISGFLSP